MKKRICLSLAFLFILILFTSGCSSTNTITGSIIEYNELIEESSNLISTNTLSEEQQDQEINRISTPAPQRTPYPGETEKAAHSSPKPDNEASQSSNNTPDKSLNPGNDTQEPADSTPEPASNTPKPDKDSPKPEKSTPKPAKDDHEITPKPTAAPAKVPADGSMPYQIEVDVTNQVVTVFGRDSSGNYTKVVRQMICSTGKATTPTPLGTFKMPGSPNDRGVWGYFAKYKTWARYFTRIKGSYLFHSVLYSKKDISTLKKSTVEALGTPVSHGCIRLTVEDAKWIYNNALPGTIVNVVKKAKNSELTKRLKEKVRTGENSPAEDVVSKPTETPKPDETPKPTPSPNPTPSPKPTEPPNPTEIPSPKPTESPKPTGTPAPPQDP